MSEKQEKKPLSSRKIESMRPGDQIMSDMGENRGLRISCGKAGTKSFFYRYSSPITKKLVQVNIGRFPSLTLAEARLKLYELKNIRRAGRCPATELKVQKEKDLLIQEKLSTKLTVKKMIDIYLTQYIDDRIVNGQIIR